VAVGDAGFSESGDTDFNFEQIFESCGGLEIALGADPGPAGLAGDVVDTEASAAEQLVLGLLHHSEERREVHDARGVGVAELDSTRGDERCRHRSDYSPT